MTRRHDRLDEDDVRVRPGKGKSRPRSKDRPAHETALSGTVIAVDRGRFTVALVTGMSIYAIKARELGRKGLVVGDTVEMVGDLSGQTDAIARVIRRGERTSVLRRTADDSDPVERVIVANATQLAIVTATIDPDPSFGLIDRALVAAYDAGLDPLLIVTKSDIRGPAELERMYAPLDVRMFIPPKGTSTNELREALEDQLTVLLGHSGVGKSTLVNALIPGATRSTGRVNTVTGKGRHTSTSAQALELPSGGWIVDTPGIRSFGLAHVDITRVVQSFPDLAAGIIDCPRSCSHDEPDCALNSWIISQPTATQERLASMRRLLSNRANPALEESG